MAYQYIAVGYPSQAIEGPAELLEIQGYRKMRLSRSFLARHRLCTRRPFQWPEESLYLVRVSSREAACIRKKSRKPPRRKIVLRLPDLDHTKSAVLNSLSSPHSRPNYKFAMKQFITLVLL